MPGRGSYGPGGKWIHDRAHSLMDSRKTGSLTERYGEKRGKSIAYAIATQQAHKVGKSPKGFRTSQGVQTAKRKFDKPVKEYQKTAQLCALFDELEQIEKEAGWLKNGLIGLGMLGAVGGGAKAMTTRAVGAAAKARPAITRSVGQAGKLSAGRQALKSSGPRVGMRAARDPEVAKALNF